MKINEKTLKILFVISAMIMSAYFTLFYSVDIIYEGQQGVSYSVNFLYVAAAMVIMLPFFIFFSRTTNISGALKKHKKGWFYAVVYMTFFAAFMMVVSGIGSEEALIELTRGKAGMELIIPVLGVFALLSSFALYVFISFIVSAIRELVDMLKSEMTKKDMIIISSVFVFCLVEILVFYSKTTGVYDYNNMVYDLDSLYVYKCYYSVFACGFGFDNNLGIGGIRHPLATFIMFPVFASGYIPITLLSFVRGAEQALYAIFNAAALTMSAVFMAKTVRSSWVYLLFFVSSPFLLYVPCLEKYQVTVLFWSSYAYILTKQNASGSLRRLLLWSGAGMMITGGILGLENGKEDHLFSKERIKDYLKTFGLFAVLIVGCGRIGYFFNFIKLRNYNYDLYFEPHTSTLTIYNRVCEYLNFLKSCFISLPHFVSHADNRIHMDPVDPENTFSFLAVGILLFIVYVMIRFAKKPFVRLYIIWMVWSLIQHSQSSLSSTFNLCFAWAVIPLAVMGINSIVKNEKHRVFVYVPIALAMLAVNLSELIDIYNMLIVAAPL